MPSSKRLRRATVVASLLVFLAIGGLAYGLASIARSSLKSQVFRTSVHGADLVGSLAGRLPKLTPRRLREGFTPEQVHAADQALAHARQEGALTSFLIAGINGRIIYAEDRSLIGTSASGEPGLAAALKGDDNSGQSTGSGDQFDQLHGPALDAYVSLSRGGGVFGAIELSQPLGPLTARADRTSLLYYLTIGGGGLLVWLLVMPLVIRFARMAERQSDPGRRRRIRELRRGIEQRDLEVHYQPIVEAKTGRLKGVEALVRWHRDGELIPPAAFLPLAESSGLIRPLTDFVLEEAIAKAVAWAAEGHALSVSVNLSAKSLLDPDLAQDIEARLVRHALSSRLLHIEITETAVIEDEGQATASLEAISRLGVQVSLDDFGTGYSSMTRLSRLPIAELKIDRSFVSNLTPERAVLTKGMVDLGQALGLRVVAEGVEDHETLTKLREMDCDLVQGFYFSRPLSSDELDAWREVPSIYSDEGPDLLVEANTDGYFTKMTRAWERCLGYSRTELMSSPYIEFLHPDDLEATLAARDTFLQGPSEIMRFENRYRSRDGSYHRFAWSARSDGPKIYAIAREINGPADQVLSAIENRSTA